MVPDPEAAPGLTLRRRAPAWLPPLALAAALLPPALLAWRLWRWPGWELTDEAMTLNLWARWHAGLGQDWVVTRGSLHRALVAGLLQASGWRFGAVRAAALLIYASYTLLLWRLGRALFSPAAAWAAVLVSSAAALPAIQLGSLLSPQMQPLLWTALALAGLQLDPGAEPRRRFPWPALLWGMAVGLACLDYEGWLAAWPGVFLVLAASRRARAALAPAAAGFVLGVGLVFAWSWGTLSDWITVRHAYSRTAGLAQSGGALLGNLHDYFIGGGRALPTQGVPAAAQFPPWALPLLAASLALLLLRRRGEAALPRAALWAAALVPFSVFAFYAPAVPAQRVLAAWPALSLLAGEALALGLRKGRAPALALGLLAILGGAFEARAFVRGLGQEGDRFYGGGDALLRMGRDLASAGPLELFWELDSQPRGDVDLVAGFPEGRSAGGAVQAFAIIPWQLQPALAREPGAWVRYDAGPGQPPRWLLRVGPGQAARWRSAHLALKAFWDRERDAYDAALYRDLVAATRAPIADPIVRDALWEARFVYARRIGRREADEGEQAMALGLLRVDPILRQARDLETADPLRSRALYTEALRRDPRRREGWRALRALVQRSGRPEELAALDRRIDALPADATVEPFWLQE